MATNTLLTSTVILRKILDLLHNNLTFARSIDRQYDSSFKSSGVSGRPGTSIKVRKPVQYVIRTGKPIDVQDTVEETVTVNCATQKGIDFSFTSEDLTMNIDDFSERYLKPASARLASQIDYEGLQLYKKVYNLVGTPATSPNNVSMPLDAGAKLSDNCAPLDNRMIVLNPKGHSTLVAALTSLYNPTEKISSQYSKGLMGSALGFDFSMSQNVAQHTAGTRVATSGITINGANQTGTSLTVTNGSATTFKIGDVFTVAGCYSVNPETKQSTGNLQQFTVTADGTSTTIAISPEIITSGARQTVSASPTDTSALQWSGAASSVLPQHMAYHKNFATLVTADLQMPSGVDFAAREMFDGISLRIVKQYDINNDNFPCRLDAYYGWTAIRPEWACRITG